ncbi:MAG TPA: alpha/beta hydrolase-fold protein [Mycobacteriales bacterium]|nr:alpha/beta hydrolase-fold protein [Mycobacteriales bacterium]
MDGFLGEHSSPIVEGTRCTFLFRGEADSVWLKHSVYGLPGDQPLRRIHATDLWYVVIDLPETSRMEYKYDVVRDGHGELIDDPLNPMRATNPVGSNSVCQSGGYQPPEWAEHDPDSRPGLLEQIVLPSRALKRDMGVKVYLPARFRRAASYPLLVVHDGTDFLRYAALGTVLDNLIHRNEMAPAVVALLDPGDRLKEYANHAAHARFITSELVPELEHAFPLVGLPTGRCLMGSSFGGVASLSTAVRYPKAFGSLLLQSGSFAFTDIGMEHGGGPVFDPVVKFVNSFRDRPRKVADRVFMSCGIYEPLIYPNRSMVPLLQSTGMDVRYVESRDGHNWQSWRDRLRDGLTWLFPGPHRLVYE